MKLSNLGKRLAQIRRYWSLACSPLDYLGLTALGIARGHPFTSADLLGRMGHGLYPALNVRVKPVGARVALDLADTSHMVILDEFAFERVYDVPLPFVPDMVFDCGGHIGLFALLAAHRFPQTPVITFEPNPRNLVWLRRNIAANGGRIELVEAAVSTADGSALFADAASHGGRLETADASANASGEHTLMGQRYPVRVIDFPAFFKARNPSRPLLKIDIEGEEMNLIPALVDLLPTDCGVFFETHGGDVAWQQIGKLFTDRGFTVTQRSHWEYLNMGLALRSTVAQ
jgi:FkbM family methyltransferase